MRRNLDITPATETDYKFVSDGENMTKPFELGIDDPAPHRNWVPTPVQIQRWAKQIRTENELAAGLATMNRHEREMLAELMDMEPDHETLKGLENAV